MRNSSDGQQHKNLQGRAFRAISSYLRIVSSGASTVARSAASVAQSIVDRDDDGGSDQVHWAGFDKLEDDGGVFRRVLLLGYRSGFQVWDVEEADNVRDLVSRHDGPASFMQLLPKPIASKRSEDNFAESRPLLVVCTNGAVTGVNDFPDRLLSQCNGSTPNVHESGNGNFVPTVVRFYSLRSQSYVHMVKFRSVVYSVRCSSRIVAISQAAQIHCFDAATLEREYTILTNPIVTNPGSGGMGYGPLAVGPRWLAYSGSPVAISNSGRVSPQHLTPSSSFPGFNSNGSLVAHYAKESSKQLAAGIVTLGDMGYKKLSRYCSELLPDPHSSLQSGSPGWKGNGTLNGHLPDADNIGMVVVRDIVGKVVIAQFKAHRSPISALCFDPSGTLLVTASVHGHNINVFKIMPGSSSSGDAGASYTHLYRLQRGFTNAVIQDISFSDDSNWIMISSSRGTSHLFAINPIGGSVNLQTSDACYSAKNCGSGVTTKSAVRWPPSLGAQMHNQQSFCASGPPVTLSVVSRIRNGNNGWKGTVTGAAAAATGKLISLSGAIASSFHNCKGNNDLYADGAISKTKYHLLVFSPSGCMIQYMLRASADIDSKAFVPGLGVSFESVPESDGRLVVEAIQKWNFCHKLSRREREDNVDIYGDNGNSDSKRYPEGRKKGNSVHPEDMATATKAKNLDEKHHLYISEAELQMHQPCNALWSKPEVCFQPMMTEGTKLDGENAMLGEIEIERILTRTIEARSANLVPVFDRRRYARTPSLDCNTNGWLPHQRPVLSKNGRNSCRSSSCSLDYITDYGAVAAETQNGVEERGWNSCRMPLEEDTGYVNSSDGSKTDTRLENVNNRSLNTEAQLKLVNSKSGGSTVENHFEDEGDEFD
ncbi:autophagy-related protein 18f [Mercurialis annua]|uniref:autophagy-related protein 18f n=1 Tax=Mercurialis annua TaxID=3986 RepID=UPI0021601BDE|nr:autophagy-related protein 18f [Mercurialis annua]XP_050217931.1 autophagy-related protein 18f [Mercurialis annua]